MCPDPVGTVSDLLGLCDDDGSSGPAVGARGRSIAFWASLAAAAVLVVSGCDDKPAKPAPGCGEALTRANQMLSVPDLEAARDWTARAKKLCGADSAKSVAELEVQIAATAGAQQKRKASNEALTPALVKAVGAYRERIGREVCDAGETCTDGLSLGVPGRNVQTWTVPGDRGAFSTFTTLPTRGLGCEGFGKAETIHTKGTGETKRLHCAIKDGPLASLEVLIEPSMDRPTSDVFVFSPPWIDRDPELAEKLKSLGAP